MIINSQWTEAQTRSIRAHRPLRIPTFKNFPSVKQGTKAAAKRRSEVSVVAQVERYALSQGYSRHGAGPNGTYIILEPNPNYGAWV